MIILALAALASCAAASSFEPVLTGEVSIVGAATARVEKRIARDLPIRKDMTAVKAFCFDLCVSNPKDFASYVCYFKSGGGWYKTSLELPDDAVLRATTLEDVFVERIGHRIERR